MFAHPHGLVYFCRYKVAVPAGLPIDALELPSDVLVGLQSSNDYALARIRPPLDLGPFDRAVAATHKADHNGGCGLSRSEAPSVRRPVVGRISRLVHAKNPQAFILAAAAVKRILTAQRGDPLQIILPRFVLAGDGPLRDNLEELVANEGVGDVVEFLGGVEPSEVPSVLSLFDVFLYPTFGEF